MAIRRLIELNQEEKKIIIEELKAFFKSRPEIIFALIYGSITEPGNSGKYGDVDLALYIKEDMLHRPEFIVEAHIEAEAYKFLSTRSLKFPPLEVIVINRAPYPFLVKLLKSNYLLIKENENIFTEFIEKVSGQALANSYFRSASLRELLER